MLIFNIQNNYDLSVQQVLAMERAVEAREQGVDEEAHEDAVLQAEEDGAWRDNIRSLNKTAGGNQETNPPVHIPDIYPASYPGATRGGPGNPYADLLARPVKLGGISLLPRRADPGLQVNRRNGNDN